MKWRITLLIVGGVFYYHTWHHTKKSRTCRSVLEMFVCVNPTCSFYLYYIHISHILLKLHISEARLKNLLKFQQLNYLLISCHSNIVCWKTSICWVGSSSWTSPYSATALGSTQRCHHWRRYRWLWAWIRAPETWGSPIMLLLLLLVVAPMWTRSAPSSLKGFPGFWHQETR